MMFYEKLNNIIRVFILLLFLLVLKSNAYSGPGSNQYFNSAATGLFAPVNDGGQLISPGIQLSGQHFIMVNKKSKMRENARLSLNEWQSLISYQIGGFLYNQNESPFISTSMILRYLNSSGINAQLTFGLGLQKYIRPGEENDKWHNKLFDDMSLMPRVGIGLGYDFKPKTDLPVNLVVQPTIITTSEGFHWIGNIQLFYFF